MQTYKNPVSVLVLIYDTAHHILLLKRQDGTDLWQSVTGSLEEGETPIEAACREVCEETGLSLLPADIKDWHQYTDFEIYPRWRHRYAPDVTHNREYVFSVCVPTDIPVQLNPSEHSAFQWCSDEKAMSMVFSPSNKEAIYALCHPEIRDEVSLLGSNC